MSNPPGVLSALVQDPLSDFTLADLTPFPAIGADRLVEVLLGDVDGSEPDFGLGFANLVELSTAGEVEQIRSGLRGSLPVSVGLRYRSVEDKPNRFQPRLVQILGCFQVPEFQVIPIRR
jgi:hypothetical protein